MENRLKLVQEWLGEGGGVGGKGGCDEEANGNAEHFHRMKEIEFMKHFPY